MIHVERGNILMKRPAVVMLGRVNDGSMRGPVIFKAYFSAISRKG
jgi:hypothetical protein